MSKYYDLDAYDKLTITNSNQLNIQCVDTRQISRRPWEGLRRLLLWSLDGSSGAGTEARYISANTRTNTSLVSELVRMGSELTLKWTNFYKIGKGNHLS